MKEEESLENTEEGHSDRFSEAYIILMVVPYLSLISCLFIRNFKSPIEYLATEILFHRLNIELDFQSLFGLHVHSCTRWMRPRNPHLPAVRLIY